MKRIKDQIKLHYNDLSQRLKQVANFIIENPKLIALYPAKEIGKQTNTSETTVIRCSAALGYTGYAALQEDIRKALLLPDGEDPIQALKKGIKNDNNTLMDVMNQDIEFIKKTFEKMDEALFLEAVTSIVQAKKIIVVGLRTTYAPANWLAYSLNIVKGDTILFKGDIDDANYLLREVGEDWLVIALSFQRYVKQTISFVKAAKEKGATILAITDNELSPVGVIANYTLPVITPNPTSLKGMPTLFSILNALITSVMVSDKENVEARVDEYNQTSEHFYSFYRNEN
ncbi:MurR/RpiR family transcriptional regulator [Sutcliffiella halmapala]|uniref:MurR/RpiR family transcriptional regulator n=1 Tax=Sutcliffiella halmapala TaxID=79882 RepID=UPI0014734F7D|nr:MurR/RpiR family transcriptional regulator [Sutcliffiella halmapala]